MAEKQEPIRIFGISLRTLLTKAAILLVVAVLLGWVYGALSPRMYPEGKQFGFGYGMIHGAMMPLALPSLVMGQDVDIYAQIPTGRIYKLGYIAGINLCGLIFFGPIFWRPGNKTQRK